MSKETQAENTYTDLPVREGENVFVWFASFADETAYRSYHAALMQNQEWITSIVPALQMWGASLEETLELLPTRRSLLRTVRKSKKRGRTLEHDLSTSR